MTLIVNVIKEKSVSYVSLTNGKMSSYSTTIKEQLSYIAITLKEVLKILFHRQSVNNPEFSTEKYQIVENTENI